MVHMLVVRSLIYTPLLPAPGHFIGEDGGFGANLESDLTALLGLRLAPEQVDRLFVP